MQQRNCLLVNSGSSANLVAFSTLTSELLKTKRILPGDEVITVAAGFPTTVNPIVQHGAIPVFVDVDIKTFNINSSVLENAVTEKTKAIVPVHLFGQNADMETILELHS